MWIISLAKFVIFYLKGNLDSICIFNVFLSLSLTLYLLHLVCLSTIYVCLLVCLPNISMRATYLCLSIFLPVFLFYFISEFYTHPLPFFMSLIFVVKKQLTSDQLMAERDRIIEMNFCPLRNTHTHIHTHTHTHTHIHTHTNE